MLKPSLEEYKLIRADLAEIRDQITKYMGFIVTIIGGASVLSKVLSGDKLDAIGVLLVLMFTMVVVTLLFEIIWYKFRSHNRHAGYIQMLSHEIGLGAMDLTSVKGAPDEQKNYLDKLADQYYDVRHQDVEDGSPMIKFITALNEVHSWEFVLSRYRHAVETDNSHSFKTMKKVKYSYVLGNKLRHRHFKVGTKYIDLDERTTTPEYDISFYKEIISEMIARKDMDIAGRLRAGAGTMLDQFLRNLRLLKDRGHSERFVPAAVQGTSVGPAKKRYHFSGWGYPRMLTSVGLIGVLIVFFFACYEAMKYHFVGFALQGIDWGLTLEVSLILACMLFMLLVWLGRYAYGVIELESGYESIDYYCWTFLPFRIQFLNGRGIVPLYFSRSFMEFMKTRLLYHNLSKLQRRADLACSCTQPVGPYFECSEQVICSTCRDKLLLCYRSHHSVPKELKAFDEGLWSMVYATL